jgi:phage tail-like protein
VADNPYLAYNFRVKWDGRYVAAVTSVSGLSRARHPAVGQSASSMKLPGQTDYEPVRLERGITTDSEFVEWAGLLAFYPNTSQLGNQVSLREFRKQMQIELYNQVGQLVMRYDLYNCWPSEYVALPELVGDANVVAIASMTIQHEGWDRDTSVTPPPP